MTHEPSGHDHEATTTPSDASPGRIRILLLVIVIVALGLVVVRFVKKDVVSQWDVLASCSSATGIGPGRVSSALDTSACLIQPADPGHTRGWPIVTFVLPPEVGPDPRITGITSDGTTRTMSITYVGAPRSEGTQTGGPVLVFVEIPPGDVPPVPFTIKDAAGSTTVTSVPPIL